MKAKERKIQKDKNSKSEKNLAKNSKNCKNDDDPPKLEANLPVNITNKAKDENSTLNVPAKRKYNQLSGKKIYQSNKKQNFKKVSEKKIEKNIKQKEDSKLCVKNDEPNEEDIEIQQILENHYQNSNLKDQKTS